MSLAQNAIALLIELAERGELDPWDVQVVEVIDRFLSSLTPVEQLDRLAYEENLSSSGQAFLYASMLVLLKADNLARAANPEPELAIDNDLSELEGFNRSPLPANLERQLRRRAIASPPPQRRVTLQELINQIKLIEGQLESQTPRHRSRRARPQSQRQAVRTIAQLAHHENLTETALELEQFLLARWPQLVQGQDWLEFEQLLRIWVQAQPQSLAQYHAAHQHQQDQERQRQVSDRVGVFWALLFLSAQSKVELSQAEFYQELKVRTLTEWSDIALPD